MTKKLDYVRCCMCGGLFNIMLVRERKVNKNEYEYWCTECLKKRDKKGYTTRDRIEELHRLGVLGKEKKHVKR